MNPQVTISEKLFKRLLTIQAVFAGLLFAFCFFVFNIYRDCNENGVTLLSINMALIYSAILGITIFAVYFVSNRKHWRKFIEDDEAETKKLKVCKIILGSSALLALVGGVLHFNHLQFANIVFWIGGIFCLITFVVLLILKRKKK